MADEPQVTPPSTIRAINWREVFPFTNIFRSFRVAVHPSKLVLGLLALLMLYIGGRVLDGFWPSKSLALPGEAARFEEVTNDKPGADFGDLVKAGHTKLQDAYAGMLMQHKVIPDPTLAKAAAEKFDEQSRLKATIMGERQISIDQAKQTRDKALADAEKQTDATKKDDAKKAAQDGYLAAVAAADAGVSTELSSLRRMVPHGNFAEFFDYEVEQVNGVVRGVLANEWLVKGGVKDRVMNFLAVGPRWLWGQHTLYAALFTLLFLLVWAVFGGAITRIAAVQVARDEKISVRQALRFSVNKVLSFVFAPIIPLIIVVIIGLIVAVGGLLFYIPIIGPIVASGLFFLALIAGVVITLVLFGTVGGMNLMFPTIAVEGSDSFDAISRSFSYVFARPWRMLFYTIIAIAYGALTYLFVRLFVSLTLGSTHYFVSWFLRDQPEAAGYYFNWIWPMSDNFWRLPYDINFAGLKWSEAIAAFLISFWVYISSG